MIDKLFLVRHGRPAVPEGVMIGSRSDPDLSPEGKEEAGKLKALLGRLGALGLPCVSSPALRCLRTAKIAGLTPRVVDGLRELDLGLWDGLAKEQVMRDWPELFAQRGRDLEGVRPPMGESFADLAERVLGAFHELDGAFDGGLVVIGHRGALWALACSLTRLPLGLYGVIEHRHCGVHLLKRGERGFRLEAANLSPLLV
ncbi:MAG: histidine phosphatase family protein [Thermanaerothrix sp.]|nr:histidine phosphatase family protein [Thermanaerothrix sp.]